MFRHFLLHAARRWGRCSLRSRPLCCEIGGANIDNSPLSLVRPVLSRLVFVSTSHGAWDVDALGGVHATHSANNLGTALLVGGRGKLRTLLAWYEMRAFT